MRHTSIHQKLTRSYLSLIVAVAVLMLAGFLLTIWLSTLPNIRLTMQSKLTELQNRLNSQMDYLEQAADTPSWTSTTWTARCCSMRTPTACSNTGI